MKALILLAKADTSDEALLALDICSNASRFGLEVSVAAFEDGALAGEFERFGFRFYRVHKEPGVDLNAVYSLRTVVRSGNFDIVHAFGPAQALIAYSSTLGIKRIKRVLSYFSEDREGRFGSKRVAKLMDANIVPSRSFFSRLRKKSGIDTKKNFYLIQKGVDENRVKRDASAFRKALNAGEKTKIVGMAADFDGTVKCDHLTVCKSLPEVFKKHERSCFVFMGSVEAAGEDDFEACIDLCDTNGIGGRVFFVGRRPDPNPWMSSLAAYVYSASSSSFPTSVVEAMLAGIPVVVSDTESLLELTDEGNAAGVFVRGDEKELSDSLNTLLSNKKVCEKRARDAREFARSNYSIDNHLASLKTLYFELSGSPEKGKKPEEKEEEVEEKSKSAGSGSLLGLD